MPWSLVFTRRAERDLGDLPQHDRQAMRRALELAADDPGSADLRKLAGREGRWRLRVARWRAILRLDNAAGQIRVIRVLPRARAYRD